MNTLVRGLLIVLSWTCVSGSNHAAELPDPAASLAPRDLIAALAALRQPYAERPADPDVTERIVLCYVGLCLSGSVRELASFGPWLDYARVIVKERQAARGGKPPHSWAEAKAELWVTWLGGDAVATLAGLDAWPDAAKDPLGRVLRAYASGERGELSPDDGPWARMALLWLSDNRTNGDLSFVQHYPKLDPLMVERSRTIGTRAWCAGECEQPLRQWVQDVAWMLLSRELTDAVALPHLQALAAALHVSATDPGRVALAQAIKDATRQAQLVDPVVIATCLEAIEVGLDASHGLDGQPRTLAALGDVARWLADRSLAVVVMVMDKNRWGSVKESFADPLVARCPDWPACARIALTSDPDLDPPAGHERLVAVLTTELTKPHRISPRAALLLLPIVVEGPCAKDFPRLIGLLDQHLGLDEPAVLGWMTVPTAWAGMLPLMAPRLRHAQTRAYRDLSVTFYASRLRNGPLLNLKDLKPAATWIDPIVDQTTLPWPHLQTSEYLAVVWHGWLKVERAGIYRLATESDDGSQLRIDAGDAVDNSGSHGMQRRELAYALTAGWHAVTLEFKQGGGGAGCRLLWALPGNQDLSVIPATALAHGGEHAAGLSADGYRFADASAYEHARARGPSPAWLAAANDPGFYQLHIEVCRRALINGDPTSARASALILGERAKAGLAPYPPALRDHVGTNLIAQAPLMVLFYCGNPDPAAAKIMVQYLGEVGPSEGAYYPDEEHLNDNGGRRREDLSSQQLGFLLEQCIHAGLAADLFTRIEHRFYGWDKLMMGSCALALGRLPEAHRYLAESADENVMSHSNYRSNTSRYLLEWALLDRMYAGHDPDAKNIQGLLDHYHATPEQALAGRWLSGELPWAEVQTEAKQTANGERLTYYRGLYELTVGQFDAAKTHFTGVVKDHPEWSEADTAAGLLAWLATLTPEQRAALPKAKPLASDTAAPAQSNF